MGLAQRLYEGVELGSEGQVGLITYMRTDSVRVANEALTEVRQMIGSDFGAPYLPESPNFYKSKKDTQDAHEAIRPSSAARHPDSIKQYLQDDEYKVYKLIWQRFVASQMTPAVFDQTTVDIDAKTNAETYAYRVTGSVPKFDGFLDTVVIVLNFCSLRGKRRDRNRPRCQDDRTDVRCAFKRKQRH